MGPYIYFTGDFRRQRLPFYNYYTRFLHPNAYFEVRVQGLGVV
jgi:hypothetical protein